MRFAAVFLLLTAFPIFHRVTSTSLAQTLVSRTLTRRARIVDCLPHEERQIRECAADLDTAVLLGMRASREQSADAYARARFRHWFGNDNAQLRHYVYEMLSAVNLQFLALRQPGLQRPAGYSDIDITCVDVERGCRGRRSGYRAQENALVIVRVF